MLGKTNMDEFGMGSFSRHSAHGAVINPLGDPQVTFTSVPSSHSSLAFFTCVKLVSYALEEEIEDDSIKKDPREHPRP